MDSAMTIAAPFAYLNMAGAGPVSDEVLETTRNYLKIEQLHGAYDTELDHSPQLDKRVYRQLAKLLHCDASDIAIFENATRAWIEVVSRVPLDGAKSVFTTQYEYAGNLQFLKSLAHRHDLELVVIPCDSNGDIDVEWLRKNMSGDVGLVSVVHVPSCCGIVNPVEEIGQVLAGHSAVYIVDACQAVGQAEIDVSQIGCDALTGAGRKFLCGPRGTGFAYVSADLRNRIEPGFVDLHLSDFREDGTVTKDVSSARFLEAAERNCGAILGLSIAIDEAIAGDGRRNDGINHIREGVSALKGVIPIDPGRTRGGIFSFRHEDVSAGDIVAELRRQGVAAWRIKGSHTPLYMLPQGHVEAVRLSSNKICPEDGERVVRVLSEILAG